MSSVKKKCKVVMLSNEKASSLGLSENNKLYYFSGKDKEMLHIPSGSYVNKHIYILSDDEIKEGDYCINLFSNSLLKVEKENDIYYDVKFITGGNISNTISKETWSNAKPKKIIATTDRSLMIKNHKTNQQSVILMPAPSLQFMWKYAEKYNAGTPIVDVMVEYDIDMINELSSGNIPSDTCLKINPKDNTITITSVKDNWNREEVIANMRACGEFGFLTNNNTSYDDFIIERDNWIEQNL